MLEFLICGMSTVVEPILTPSSLFSVTNAFFYLLIPIAALWYAYFRMCRKRLYELAAEIPGPKGLPLIGNAYEFMGDSNKIFENIYVKSFEYAKDGAPAKCWIGPRLIVFLTDPRDVEIILSSSVYIDKAPEYRFFQPWLGNGLLISTGETWRAHRKLIAPTFHLNVLKSFMGLFNTNSRLAVEKMRKEGTKAFDVHHYMSEATVEILLETAMGVDKGTQEASGFEYAAAVMKLCDILHLRHTKVWMRPDFLFNMTKYAKEQVKLLDFVHGLTINVMAKKKAAFLENKQAALESGNSADKTKTTEAAPQKSEPATKEKEVTDTVKGLSFGQSSGLKDDLDVDEDIGEKKRQAFLDLLIESADNGNVLTDKEVREQVDTIMFEGHDTTAAGSSFFLCIMGVRPDIQEKVVEELEQIFGDSDRPCTFQDTLEMKYLERCIMETLRMYPPVPIIARELQQEVQLKSTNVSVPAKCTVIIGTLKLHRNPKIYPNPEHFDPDNFLPEKTSNRHYYAFVPFSAGPRSCVGRKYAMLKLKILLSTILRNYKVYSDIPQKDWKLQADIILKRSDGFMIRLEPRKMKPKPATVATAN
uniref:Cytochrome P450 4G68 n=1 Tax=Bemisia tabaci TaxID=7038 RepID=A0A3G2M0D3_BEMTA|nr:cytochrome P450 4G68 [Bemisia tabaci]